MQNNLVLNSTEERALTLLGQGIDPSIVASALGVTPSSISQLLSKPEFAAAVAELRFTSLARHSERDDKYDSLEDKLIKSLDNCLAFIGHDPLKIAAILKVINGAKRRGSSAPQSMQTQAPVVPLIMPIQVIQQFQLNGQSQVVRAGNQDLITAQPAQLKDMLTRVLPAPTITPSQNFIPPGAQNVQHDPSATESTASSG